MGYTAPVTRSTGFVVGSTQWNEFVNNDLWFATARPMCLAKRAAAFGTTNSTPVMIPWDINHLDNAGSHSVAVNPTRFTAPVAGWYRAVCNVRWTTALGDRDLRIITGGQAAGAASMSGPASSFEGDDSVYAIVHLSAGGFVEVQGLQSAGGPLNVLIDSYFWFEWIATF